MPGVPLLNLGYALGGLSQGYNQAQNQGLQQELARLQLQQAQRQQNAQGLAALALQAGLLGNNAQTNPLQTLQPPTASTPPPAPPVVAPQVNVPQPPPSDADLNTGFGDLNLNQLSDPRYLTGMPTGAEDRSSSTTGLPSGGMVSQSGAAQPQQQAPAPAPAPSPPSAQQTASAGATDTGDTSAQPSSGNQQIAAVFPNGQTMDMSSMFKTVDYGKLAQGIAQLAPRGTSQADIFEAVLDLGKLAEGDKVQQQQAGLLARALLGGNFKLAAVGEQQAGALQRTQIQQQGATGRTQLQQAGAGERTQAQIQSRQQIAQEQIASREKIAEAAQDLRRQGQQIRNVNQQRALDLRQQAIENSVRNSGRADLTAQINAIRIRISTVKPDAAGNYTDQQQAQLRAFNDQIAHIASQIAPQQQP